MLIVCGYGAWMFYIGGLSFWGPDYMYQHFNLSKGEEAIILGSITIVAGLLGTFSGSYLMDKIFAKTGVAN